MRFAISSLSYFLEFGSILSFGPYFFVPAYLLYSKGWSLKYSPGWGSSHCYAVVQYVGVGSEVEQYHLPGSLDELSVLPPLCTRKLGSSDAESQVGRFVYVLRTLWVSPMNSPVRLGVSLAAATPQVFIARGFEAFPTLESGLCGLSHPPVVCSGLSTCKCQTTGSASCHLAHMVH